MIKTTTRPPCGVKYFGIFLYRSLKWPRNKSQYSAINFIIFFPPNIKHVQSNATIFLESWYWRWYTNHSVRLGTTDKIRYEKRGSYIRSGCRRFLSIVHSPRLQQIEDSVVAQPWFSVLNNVVGSGVLKREWKPNPIQQQEPRRFPVIFLKESNLTVYHCLC